MLTDEQRHGVVWRLLQSARCLSGQRQRRLVLGLQRALECEDESQLLQRVLGLPSQPSAASARISGGIGHFPSLLLQALLALAGPHCCALMSALHSLPTARLLSLACDQRGVHVLEAALMRGGGGEQQAAAEQRSALLDRLLPLTASLAADRRGSWLVQRMWTEADASRRKRMKEAAAAAQQRLHSTAGGRILLGLTQQRSVQ